MTTDLEMAAMVSETLDHPGQLPRHDGPAYCLGKIRHGYRFQRPIQHDTHVGLAYIFNTEGIDAQHAIQDRNILPTDDTNVGCILTRGMGRMEQVQVPMNDAFKQGIAAYFGLEVADLQEA